MLLLFPIAQLFIECAFVFTQMEVSHKNPLGSIYIPRSWDIQKNWLYDCSRTKMRLIFKTRFQTQNKIDKSGIRYMWLVSFVPFSFSGIIWLCTEIFCWSYQFLRFWVFEFEKFAFFRNFTIYSFLHVFSREFCIKPLATTSLIILHNYSYMLQTLLS